MAKLSIRLRIDLSTMCSLGPGKITLLERIELTGSLSQAARDLQMSYRRAWLLLHSLNSGFRQPLVLLNTGGRGGGGARLTPFGSSVIGAYRALELATQERAAQAFDALLQQARLGPQSAAQPRRPLKRKRVRARTA